MQFQDFSCVNGFCPSFVTVTGGAVKKQAGAGLPAIANPGPSPRRVAGAETYNIAITGVGGGGVMTIGHIIGMAAHIDGIGAQVLDITGLAQKGGAVVSHVRLARDAKAIAAQRIPAGEQPTCCSRPISSSPLRPKRRQLISGAARARSSTPM